MLLSARHLRSPRPRHNVHDIFRRSHCKMLTALQVLDTVDLLDGCWADRHGCRQAGGILATSASLLDTSSTCLDTSCLDDLMDAVEEDGLSGGGLSAAGGPSGEACSALAACLVGGTAEFWQPGAHCLNLIKVHRATARPACLGNAADPHHLLRCAALHAEPAAGVAAFDAVQRLPKPAQECHPAGSPPHICCAVLQCLEWPVPAAGGAASTSGEHAKSLPRLRLTRTQSEQPLALTSLGRTQSDSAAALSAPGRGPPGVNLSPARAGLHVRQPTKVCTRARLCISTSTCMLRHICWHLWVLHSELPFGAQCCADISSSSTQHAPAALAPCRHG